MSAIRHVVTIKADDGLKKVSMKVSLETVGLTSAEADESARSLARVVAGALPSVRYCDFGFDNIEVVVKEVQ